ncbi:hypothetical protein [Seleniivibrio woodruffii]|uniref:hypothetical protein n=1 Tax=Seleniivibrio woodruffii TaxID=1078050 RepID=UPI0026F0A0B1|nr:hypothetical protein [Seleniivibrio woodruffii]
MVCGTIKTGIKPLNILRWTENREEVSVFPPAVADINGEYFFISGFEEADGYYVLAAHSLAHALNLSVSVHGRISMVELANISQICTKLCINYSDIKVFSEYNIKGRQNFQTLEAVASYPEPLKKYLRSKDIPLKTLAVFNKLNDICKGYVADTIAAKDISLGDFRNLVNILFDMTPQITQEHLRGDVVKNLSAERDKARQTFMEGFGRLTSELPVSISSPDSFETGRLTFSFTAGTAEEAERILRSVESKTSTIQKIYGFLDEQGIS